MNKLKVKALATAVGIAAICSCSTTKVLQPGQYRLAKNDVRITNDPNFSTNEISQYVKQQPNKTVIFGWSPGLNIYNWSKGSGKGMDKLWEKLGDAPVVFNPSLVESSRTNIMQHLEYLGYYDSEVLTNISTSGKLAKVQYIVTLGHRLPIDEIRFHTPEGTFAEDFAEDIPNVTIKQGDFLSEKSLEAESARSAAVMRDKAYYDCTKSNYFFIADTLSSGKTVLNYDIREYTRNDTESAGRPMQKYRFGNVRITHSDNIKFRPSVLKKFNLIKPGDEYSETVVNNTYNRLSALKVFNGISVVMNPSDSNVVDCDIRLTDSKLQGIKFNLEASTNSSGLMGLSPQLSWYHKNIFHGGEWLTLGFTGNFQFRPSDKVSSTEFGSTASLSLPRFLGLSYRVFTGPVVPRTEVKASFNYQNRPEYRRTMLNVNYSYNWHNQNLYYEITPLRIGYVKLFDLSDSFAKTLSENPYLQDTYQTHLDAGVGGMIYFTTNSDLVPKTSYHYERLSVDLSGNVVGLFRNLLPENESGTRMIMGAPYTQYVRGELSLGRTVHFGKDEDKSIALRFLAGAGYAYGNSTALPFEKQFYCGGASSMRAWQARSLGPGFEAMNENFIIPSQTGDFKLEADIEYRFPLFWKIECGVFAEAGNVWNFSEGISDFYKSIAVDWGLGLRINLNFILLRVDAGFKVLDPARPAGSRVVEPNMWFNSDGCAVHFGVGYPF